MGIIWAIWGYMGPYGSIWGSIQVLPAVCGANFFFRPKMTPQGFWIVFVCWFSSWFGNSETIWDYMGPYESIWGSIQVLPAVCGANLFFFGQKCHPKKFKGVFLMIFFIFGQFRPALFEAFQNNYGQACSADKKKSRLPNTFPTSFIYHPLYIPMYP